jgi:hypothetical protein
MRKPAGVAVDLFEPSEHGPEERDEDNLQIEGHGDEDGDGDIAEQVICGLVRSLADAGPAAVHLLGKLIGSLEEMSEATMKRDHAGLEEAACDAHEVLNKLIGD